MIVNTLNIQVNLEKCSGRVEAYYLIKLIHFWGLFNFLIIWGGFCLFFFVVFCYIFRGMLASVTPPAISEQILLVSNLFFFVFFFVYLGVIFLRNCL